MHTNLSKHLALTSALLLLLAALPAIAAPPPPSGLHVAPAEPSSTTTVQTASSISRHGITWFFDTEVEYGQFANGDYWVVGPVTIIDIDPKSTVDSTGWVKNGSMINPRDGETQGYDSKPSAGSYSAENNVGRPNGSELSASNPLQLAAGTSLISSRSVSTPSNWPQIQDASVLTVLSAAAPDGSLRPPYAGDDKTIRWNVSDIDWAYLASRQVPRSSISGNVPDVAGLHSGVERLWIDHDTHWTFSRIHPASAMPDYGREIAKTVADVALGLLLDFPQSEIEALMISYLQIGIDTYGVATTGGVWSADGGVFLGRKLPLVFAGVMLQDSSILAYADGTQRIIFQEDQQTYYVSQYLIDISQAGVSSAWNPDTRNANYAPYSQDMLGMPEWGIRYYQWRTSGTTWAPESDWGAMYRTVNAGPFTGSALAAHILGAVDEWNWPSFFDYVDRYVTAGEAGDHTNWPGGVGSTNGASSLTYHMWNAFRANYGPIWN